MAKYATVTPRFRVNRKSPVTLADQVTEKLAELIDAGELPSGEILPGERSLAESLKVDRDVVRRSYRVLEERGLIEKWGHMGKRVRPQSKRKRQGSSKGGS